MAETIADFILKASIGDDTYNILDVLFEFRSCFYENSVNYEKKHPDSELSKAIKHQGILYRIQNNEIEYGGINITFWSENPDLVYELFEDLDEPVAYISQTEEDSFGISVYGLETYLFKKGYSIYDYKDEDALNDSINIIEDEREIV